MKDGEEKRKLKIASIEWMQWNESGDELCE